MKVGQTAYIGALPDERAQRDYVNFYAHLHRVVDEKIGRLLAALGDPGDPDSLRARTVIARTSDHGELAMSHGGLRQKMFNGYEESIRVPLVISNPELFPQPRESDALVSLVDLVPTLLGLAGQPADPERFDGLDLGPILTGEQESVRDAVLFTYDDHQAGTAFQNVPGQPNRIRCVRDARWKYAVYLDPAGAGAPGVRALRPGERPGRGAQPGPQAHRARPDAGRRARTPAPARAARAGVRGDRHAHAGAAGGALAVGSRRVHRPGTPARRGARHRARGVAGRTPARALQGAARPVPGPLDLGDHGVPRGGGLLVGHAGRRRARGQSRLADVLVGDRRDHRTDQRDHAARADAGDVHRDGPAQARPPQGALPARLHPQAHRRARGRHPRDHRRCARSTRRAGHLRPRRRPRPAGRVARDRQLHGHPAGRRRDLGAPDEHHARRRRPGPQPRGRPVGDGARRAGDLRSLRTADRRAARAARPTTSPACWFTRRSTASSSRSTRS